MTTVDLKMLSNILLLLVVVVHALLLQTAPLAPAPLVCHEPGSFVAVSWNPTCECTGVPGPNVSYCRLCYNGTTELSAYSCRKYDNIVNLAQLRGGFGPGDDSSGSNWFANQIDFGTYTNHSVPCAIDPTALLPANATCTAGTKRQPAPFLGPGTAAQPPGQRFLQLDFVNGGADSPCGAISAHPDDVIPLPQNCSCYGDDRDPYCWGPFTGVEPSKQFNCHWHFSLSPSVSAVALAWYRRTLWW